MMQVKRDQRIICLSPFITIQKFSEIWFHGANRKGRGFSSLSHIHTFPQHFSLTSHPGWEAQKSYCCVLGSYNRHFTTSWWISNCKDITIFQGKTVDNHETTANISIAVLYYFEVF